MEMFTSELTLTLPETEIEIVFATALAWRSETFRKLTPAELEAKNSPPSMNPVVAFELLITRLFAKNVGVNVRLVSTKESEVNVSVWAVVTEPANPRPVNVATPSTALTVRD
jgi:hypothetical protein